MVRDAPQAALLTMRVLFIPAKSALVLRSPPKAGVSKDGSGRTACPEVQSNAIALLVSGGACDEWHGSSGGHHQVRRRSQACIQERVQPARVGRLRGDVLARWT